VATQAVGKISREQRRVCRAGAGFQALVGTRGSFCSSSSVKNAASVAGGAVTIRHRNTNPATKDALRRWRPDLDGRRPLKRVSATRICG
jgi:hypothetical protein